MTTEVCKLNKRDQQYVDQLLGELREGVGSLNQVIDAAIEPLTGTPELKRALESQGEVELAEAVDRLDNAIRKDLDYHVKDLEVISETVSRLNGESRPTKARHMGRFAAQCMAAGAMVADLNSKILTSTITLSDDYIDLIKKAKLDDKPEVSK